MLSINTNLSSLITQDSLNSATKLLNLAIERMTTGYKINNAKDNAANYSIIEDLNTRISSMLQVQNNTEDGISMLLTAEGGLNQIRDMMQRVRDLAMQASNGNYDSKSREAMQAEADALIEQINQIKNSMQYDGMSLYEAPADNAVARIAQSANIQQVQSTFTLQEEETLLGTSYPISGADNLSAPDSFSLNQPMMRSAVAPMSLDEGIATASADDIISGSVNIAYQATVDVDIDGVVYTVTNNASGVQAFSYSKDKTTGVVSITCNNMTIVGQAGKAHNIYLKGSKNNLTTGDLQDRIELDESCLSNKIYGGAENDTFISNIVTAANYNTVYGENGNDTITGHWRYIYGGDGDDNISINTLGNLNVICDGQGGNDIINVSGSSATIYGGDGDDDFTINGSNLTIDGGSGNNTIVDNGSNNIKANVPGANTLLESFGAYETKTILINNISYEITNDKNEERVFLYNVDGDGKITFSSDYFTIKGDLNKAHNVILNKSNITFYGGNQKDYIYAKSGSVITIYGLDGDDEITTKTNYTTVYGGKGNDTIKIEQHGFYSYYDGGEGDDTYSITTISEFRNTTFYDIEGEDEYYLKDTGKHVTVIDTDGAKTFSGVNDLSDYKIYGIDGYQNMDGYIEITGSETKNITINDRKFQIQRLSSSYYPVVAYKYDSTKDSIIFSGRGAVITALDNDKDYSIELYGYGLYYKGSNGMDNVISYSVASVIETGAGNDIIYSYAGDSSVSAGDGDDYIYASNSTINGGAGNDIIDWYSPNAYTANGGAGDDIINVYGSAPVMDAGGNNIYNVNVSGANISGGDGNDTFYINGDNNNINCGGGDDYIVVNGQNNTINGEGGSNSHIDNSGGTTTITNSVADTSYRVTFSALNESKEVTLEGKTYTVKNLVNGNNQISFSKNPNTGVITIAGSDLEIISASNQQNELHIQGSNNNYQGSNLLDKVTITSGSNNTLYGNAGNDILISDYENNSILGGDGADTINVNKSTNLVIDGDAGNDTININSNNNTQINTGLDNDTVNINGENNKLTTQDGDNKINITGNSNTILAQDGNNRLSVVSSNNMITFGSGANTLGINGDSNIITANNIFDKITIEGNNNSITQTNGNNEIKITGNGNDYTSTLGQKDVSVLGSGNTIITGTNNDEFEIKGNSNSITSLGGTNEFNINGDNNQIKGGSGVDTIKIKGNSNTAIGAEGNDKFTIKSGDLNNIDGEGGYNTLMDNGINTNYQNASIIKIKPFECNLQVGINSDESSVINVSISFSLFDFSVDFSSVESALGSLEEIDSLISSIDEQLLNIGSTINRLELILDEQSVKLENMISSRSTMRDADIAQISSEFIRQQILQQASATLLATANQSPSIALQLI